MFSQHRSDVIKSILNSSVKCIFKFNIKKIFFLFFYTSTTSLGNEQFNALILRIIGFYVNVQNENEFAQWNLSQILYVIHLTRPLIDNDNCMNRVERREYGMRKILLISRADYYKVYGFLFYILVCTFLVKRKKIKFNRLWVLCW